MNTIGIIAEYNPFHSGHAYQIATARKELSADCVVCVMSGNFVERGEPAIIDMHQRARIAVSSGCDLVVMLPVQYSVSASDYFANGAVSILDSLGNIDHLVFGTEADSLDVLNSVAAVLADEPKEYRALLKNSLASGESYAAARRDALCSYLDKDISDILSKPNNILAIDYLKSLICLNSSIKPHAVKRVGAGYNDTSASGGFSSATHLRQELLQGDFETVSHYVPACGLEALSDAYKHNALVTPEDFYPLISYALIREKDRLTDFLDVDNSVANTISAYLTNESASDFSASVSALSSKNVTAAKIRRILFHILLGITKDSFPKKACYARILAFNDTGREYLNSIKKTAAIPFFSNPQKARNLLSGKGYEMFCRDMDASEIYNLIVSQKSGIRIPNEFRRKLF